MEEKEDFYLRFTDCLHCEQRSIPNAQGVMVHHSTRNILFSFNKILNVCKYERTNKELTQNFKVKEKEVRGIF